MMYFNLWGTPIFASIDEIVHRARIEAGLAYKVNKSGKTLLTLCPSHEENTPSCSINLETHKNHEGKVIQAGTVNCFGCDFSGDLATYVSLVFGKKDEGMFGYRWIIKNFVTGEYDDRKINVNISREKQPQKELNININDYGFNYEPLKNRFIDRKYMYLYNIRYNPKNKSLLFPVYDFNNKIIGVQEKFIHQRRYYNYGETRYLYGLNNLQGGEELWVTEGPLDAISCVKNEKNAVAFMRTKINRQVKMLKKLPHRVIYTAFDNDHAGEKAHNLVKKECSNKLVKRVLFPEGKDPNDVINNFEYTVIPF